MIERKRLRVGGVRARGRPKEVPGDLKSVNIMVEIGRFKEFREMCEEVGVTTSEGIRQLIDKEIEQTQKNLMGTLVGNPINISYEQHIKPSHIEPLDKYLEENFVTSRHWFSYYAKIDDIDHVQRHEALAVTISKQAKQRANYLKTGKYLVQ